VPHHLLLHKLKHYGLHGKALDWIADFLSGHSQRVVCGGYSSESVSVISGLPQDSVIGPLIFLMYCTSMTLLSTCPPHVATLQITVFSIEGLIQPMTQIYSSKT